MSFNTFGKIFRFTTWGESHGPAIGCVIDGCPPNIPISDSDQFIYPLFGERLDSLANKYYGDPNLWWIISKANGLKGVINIPKDTQIRIPGEVDKILEDFRNLNSSGTSSTGGSSSGGGAQQGAKIGFSSSTTWTCPAAITQVTVELWGGGGGGRGGGGQRGRGRGRT